MKLTSTVANRRHRIDIGPEIKLNWILNQPNFYYTSKSLTWQSMADWGPVVVAVILFVLLTPGLLFQIPARGRVVEFGNMQTSGASILVHTIIFFGLITIFTIAIRLHIYTG
ncbi:unnamed protein product [Arabidopsis lyrata]|nr:unnamed protein product [Arabidopsis lyrata]